MQGEMHLRMKLQEALTDAQSAKTQAANLLALNSGLIEEVKNGTRGFAASRTWWQGDDEAAAVTVHIDSDPATASPTERPRLKQSYETGPGSPFSFGADATPQLWERDQHVATLEAELVEARLRLQHLERKIRSCKRPASTARRGLPRTTTAWAHQTRPPTLVLLGPSTRFWPLTETRIDEHGFIAPPSPAGSDSDPHLPAPWSASVDQTSQSSPPGSSTRREASLQAQLQSRDIQVFELLERNEQLEASLQAATTDRDSRVAELQTHATRLANSLQAQLWKRDAQVTDLQNQVVDLDASLQRATAEAVRYRQQCMETVEQCERYALELRGLERREELLMNKLRTLEMSLMHRGQEVDGLRAELANTTEQLAGMRDKAMAAEVEAGSALQACCVLEDQLEDPAAQYPAGRIAALYRHRIASSPQSRTTLRPCDQLA
ncbi:hypothetical protein PLESTM_000913100 [Pleodorina starrii]|nr:hypothetical protein PLESTM_000913100 [Pleodorina starrii]